MTLPVFVDQNEIGTDNPRANCLAACVASIVGVPLASIPDIYDAEQRGVAWFVALRDALAPYGLVPVIYDEASTEFPSIAPAGYHIACGPSPRLAAQSHAVVALDGDIVHDPHPTKQGLPAITWWILLIPVRRVTP